MVATPPHSKNASNPKSHLLDLINQENIWKNRERNFMNQRKKEIKNKDMWSEAEIKKVTQNKNMWKDLKVPNTSTFQ